jgi:hypothetical protein
VRIALLAAAVVLTPAPAAHADTWHAPDAKRDVATFTHDAEPPPCGTDVEGTDPADARRDITRLGVEHDRDMVTVRIFMGEVSRRDTNTFWTLHLRVPGHAYLISVGRSERGKHLETFMAKAPRVPDTTPEDECGSTVLTSSGVWCDGLAATADPRRDRIEVTVPRSCLKRPRWVQAGVQDAAFTGDEQRYKIEHDYWAPPGVVKTGFVPPYGPKVFRG